MKNFKDVERETKRALFVLPRVQNTLIFCYSYVTQKLLLGDDVKNHQVEDLVSLDGRSHGWLSLVLTYEKTWKRSVIHQCGVCQNTSMLRKEEIDPERKMTWSGFWVSICVYLWIMLSLLL